MLIRVTWALVIVGFGLLLGGFFMDDQNVLLILAIAVELVAIILVLASWARRAKDAADAYDEDLAFGSSTSDDTAEEDELLETFADEEFVVGGRESRPAAAKRKPAARKAKPKSPARKTSSTTAKRKPAAKAKAKAKPKAKPAARKPAKPKPQRRRHSAE